jgi:hypothetical protein
MGHGTQFKDLREILDCILSYSEPPASGWAEVRPWVPILFFSNIEQVGSSLSSTLCAHHTVYVSQGVIKICRLSWLTNSALVYEDLVWLILNVIASLQDGEGRRMGEEFPNAFPCDTYLYLPQRAVAEAFYINKKLCCSATSSDWLLFPLERLYCICDWEKGAS